MKTLNISINLESGKVLNSGFVDDKSKLTGEEVMLLAVQQDGHAIKFFSNASEKVQLEAVRRHGNAIKYIADPSEAVQLAAIDNNPYAICCIKYPSSKVSQKARDGIGRIT